MINISILKEKYPYGFAFLTKVKSKLLQRNIWPPIMENDWYKYGRHQALENCDSAPKIIVGILSKDINIVLIMKGYLYHQVELLDIV